MGISPRISRISSCRAARGPVGWVYCASQRQEPTSCCRCSSSSPPQQPMAQNAGLCWWCRRSRGQRTVGGSCDRRRRRERSGRVLAAITPPQLPGNCAAGKVARRKEPGALDRLSRVTDTGVVRQLCPLSPTARAAAPEGTESSQRADAGVNRGAAGPIRWVTLALGSASAVCAVCDAFLLIFSQWHTFDFSTQPLGGPVALGAVPVCPARADAASGGDSGALSARPRPWRPNPG